MRNRWIVLLLSPFGLVLLSAFRLLVISDYNSTTAVTIAESGGYINTLLGSVIPLLPVFIPYVALLLLLAQQYALAIIAFAFTVFVSPTPLKLPMTERLAKLDENALLRIDANQQTGTVIFLVLIFLIAAWYYRSYAEGISVMAVLFVALGLAAAPYLIHSSVPRLLRPAFRSEHQWFEWHNLRTIIAIIIGVVIGLIVITNLLSWLGAPGIFPAPSRVIAFAVAAAAVISFFPYIYNIYTLPRQSNYYVTELRQPWLQAEKITVATGQVYVGYVLSTADYWFVVLQAKSRTIVYIRDANVLSREVCQPKLKNQPKSNPPLIPLFYTHPPHIPSCFSS